MPKIGHVVQPYGVRVSANGKPLGRPPGSANLANQRLKELAQGLTGPAMEELARIAGLHREPIEKADGQPVMVPVLDHEGKQVLNPDGSPAMRAKMRRVAGSASDLARISAINTILDRGHGKAKQPLANDEENPLIPMNVGKIEIEMVPVGSPLIADNSDEIITEEDAPAAPANDVESKVA